MKNHPPEILMCILDRLVIYSARNAALDDFEERFEFIAENKSRFSALVWFVSQICFLFPGFLVDSIYGSLIMLQNYLKITVRNIVRHKIYSMINIFGLAAGMACCLLITLWVLDELSVDRYHENAENLYRIEQDQNYNGELYHVNVTPYPMGPGVKEDIPDIIASSRYSALGRLLIKFGDKKFFESGCIAVDPDFLTIFTNPILKGDRETPLNEPHSIIISERIAEKYFGDTDPIGKMLDVNAQAELTVTAVIRNTPDNTLMQHDILIPHKLIEMMGYTNESWGSNNIITYVQLNPNSSVAEVNVKITDLRFKHIEKIYIEDYPDELEEFRKSKRTEFMLRNVGDVYLYGYFGFGRPPGRIQLVYIFSAIAAFVLLIACINFMNLSTARSANRAQEVGMRKVVGARRKSIVAQFFGESVVFAFLSLFLAVLITVIVLPAFNTLSGKNIILNNLVTLPLLISMTGITLMTGLVSGSYPALYLSSFKPVNILKGRLKSGAKSSRFRRILVVLQFSLSILLIIGTMVIFNQIHFMQNKNVGYNAENVLYLPLRGDTPAKYEALHKELVQDSRILYAASTRMLPTNIGSNSSGAEWDGKNPDNNVLIGTNTVGYDFTKVIGLEIIDGRTFSREFPTDSSSAFLINEEVVKAMNKEGSVVGERFDFMGREGTIVGVMKNFHFKSMRTEIEPLALAVSTRSPNYVLIKLSGNDTNGALKSIEEIWNRVNPAYPFNFTYLEDVYDRMYRTEKRVGDILTYFTALAIMIACLGLFGLASFTAEQRTKEIGIRKVLGASAPGITALLCREFLKLVIISNILAWPAAYYLMDSWLNVYPYRISLGMGSFLLSGFLAVVIALVTVGFQALKASQTNPADSLKYE